MVSKKSGHSTGVRSIVIVGAISMIAMVASAIGFSPSSSNKKSQSLAKAYRAASAELAAKNALTRPMPIYFEKNQGQVNSSVRYLARSARYSMFLTDDAAVFSLIGGEVHKSPLAALSRGPAIDAGRMTESDLRIRLEGANQN